MAFELTSFNVVLLGVIILVVAHIINTIIDGVCDFINTQIEKRRLDDELGELDRLLDEHFGESVNIFETTPAKEETVIEDTENKEEPKTVEVSEDLSSKSFAELKKMAKEKGVPRYYRMKKEELINALKEM